MAKGTASKDKKKPAEKKSGEKSKGKAEETADKGGKVRTYYTEPDLFASPFICSVVGWVLIGRNSGRVKAG
jgi:hypothetical protein